jgi:putative PIN family toxin of toxin-antitoxin system
VKIVLDTNVFVSGVFFSGPPYVILDAWRRNKITLVISHDIFEEYCRTGETLSRRFEGVSLAAWLALVADRAILVTAPRLPQQVCSDPDDDMFLACAIAGGAKIVVTGDKALLKVGKYGEVIILSPRGFVERHLRADMPQR